MRLTLLLGLFVIFATVLGSHPFGQIRLSDEYLSPGDELWLHANVKSENRKTITVFDEGTQSYVEKERKFHELERMKVRMFIPELGVYTTGNQFDVQSRDREASNLFWDVPDVAPGEYLVRITASNDDVRDVRHRWITIR